MEIKRKLSGMRFEDATCFVLILKILFRHKPVTGLAISMLNGYRDTENEFKLVVITLKKSE